MAIRDPDATAYLDEWHEQHPGATTRVVAPLVDSEGRTSYQVLADSMSEAEAPILDLACGDGYLLELLANGPHVGVDRSAAELELARRRLGDAVPLVRSDATGLPVATRSMGGACCHYALMLLQPLETVLEELVRVLRPGAPFAAVIPASPNGGRNMWTVFRGVWQEVVAAHPVAIPPLQDDRVFDREQLAELLTDSGFVEFAFRSFSVSRQMTVDEIVKFLLLLYGPDLLPPDGRHDLVRGLELGLAELANEDGTVAAFENAELVTARRG
jgi:ubiquinone/menaquinone biosynthesis C-methylase UbiE